MIGYNFRSFQGRPSNLYPNMFSPFSKAYTLKFLGLIQWKPTLFEYECIYNFRSFFYIQMNLNIISFLNLAYSFIP